MIKVTFNITTSIVLPATPEKVWAVLTDFENYPNWNPFVTSAAGDWAAGNTVAITAGGMGFKPTVLKMKKAQELRWLGSLLFRGVFDGEHYFILRDQENGTTLLTHGEDFSGVLVSLFKSKLNKDTKAGFIAMNEALKERLATLTPSKLEY
ncbi:MAG: SRPBCC domain-containing protein [Bacteroidota bacterium]